MSEILKTEDLTRTFGSLVAVNHVNFSVEEGEIRSVIGPNGAGKSTFMDLIINKTPCTSGKVFSAAKRLRGCRRMKLRGVDWDAAFKSANSFPN